MPTPKRIMRYLIKEKPISHLSTSPVDFEDFINSFEEKIDNNKKNDIEEIKTVYKNVSEIKSIFCFTSDGVKFRYDFISDLTEEETIKNNRRDLLELKEKKERFLKYLKLKKEFENDD
jgi:hypothetical protein